jgi:hypothetical protein
MALVQAHGCGPACGDKFGGEEREANQSNHHHSFGTIVGVMQGYHYHQVTG